MFLLLGGGWPVFKKGANANQHKCSAEFSIFMPDMVPV